ncbi:hypothetical protein N0V84_002029 [Fusarium piperis]|uniref:F-box domain-containing protein n=1 Tax=Fusarium piperis TaxID=1435070 RepID=A0A9W8WJV7_9HYPO|nr:hypothetical protein N0V84_002029 [Fusarium piperis]
MSFASLPTELLQEVGHYCDRQQLASLAQVNRELYAIFNPLLYRHSISNDLPSKTCVRWAVENNSLNTLKHAINQGADINGSCATRESDVLSGMSSTPLHIATKNGFHEIVRWLLDNGANLDEPSVKLCRCNLFGSYNTGLFWYPLHFAMCHSDEEMLRLFLQKGAYFSARRVPGLRCAIHNERLDIIDLLAQQPSFDPHYQDHNEQNALHYVTDVRNPSAAYQIVHKLVDYGVPMDMIGHGITPLSKLVAGAKFKPAIALLERGADPCFDTHNHKMRALDWCFNARYIDPTEPESVTKELNEDRRKLVALLIAKGADVNRATNIMVREYRTPLYWALLGGKDAECIRILLDAGASIRNAITYLDGSRSEGLLRQLFRKVANLPPWAPRADGPSEPFFEPYRDSVRLLLENGARVDSVDGEQSALGISCQMATSEAEIWALEFLVDNSTSQNVSLEFVEALLENAENEAVRTLLERLRDKLVGEGEKDEAEVVDE